MTSKKKIILRWLKLLVLLYCIVGLLLYYFQDRFLFHPQKLPSNYDYHFPVPFHEMMIPLNGSDSISLLKFLPRDASRRGIVVYFHGNMENIMHYASCAAPFTRAGYEVWMEDYPGFGKTTGEMSESRLYSDALQVKKLAESSCGSDSIIVYGKSLGTGIAAYVAAESKAKMLVLETPYYSIPALFSTYAFIYPVAQMSNYKIPTYSFLQDVHCPVIMFHGTADGVIPYSSAEKLKSFLKTGDEFITVQGADHQNINRSAVYFRVIDSLLSPGERALKELKLLPVSIL